MTTKSEKDKPYRRIFLVRHGKTDWNHELKCQGHSDTPLNGEGEAQARLAGWRFFGAVFDHVYSSPLSRARRTAEIIMEGSLSGKPIKNRDELREMGFGSWEGQSIPHIRETEKEGFERWLAAPFSNHPDGGETYDEIRSRVTSFADELKRRDDYEKILVVSHGGILRALIAAMLNFDDMNLMWRMRLENCSITIVDVWNETASLLLLNDTQHLRLKHGSTIASLVY
ncbi:alpha-ribazole phosphatase [Synergistales bacterium]|nr:alpha-ribazole phosphatase [Synergistales bacterium]GHV52428.1 alpha-ribazole phosphatase [Synergistales bacterium]